MSFEVEKKVTEFLGSLQIWGSHRSLTAQPNGGKTGNPTTSIGPVYIYAPGRLGGTGEGGGGGGLQLVGGGDGGGEQLLSRSSKTSKRKADIKWTDMSEEMQQEAVDCAILALEKYDSVYEMAKCIKHKFDKLYGGKWRCIVGHNFETYGDYNQGHYIHFVLDQMAFVLLKYP